ncbi:Vacuolar protein sorting-associated protein vps5 [Neophaeococcomyces mojaviensis]|uniref:Vacuolar protein sorting-associated protein vps5 n=1 Tax=Neophaeococcomyces mojaviensis TaxID=3383035 RepID=A0ACC3AF01_9EURO|nr:Vacuolar protein sorting-associated protein vps5 [Knufia sp. JES_112]
MDDSPWDDVPSHAESASNTATTPLSSETNKPSASTASSSAPSRPSTGRKPPARKVIAQSTILQPVDDSADPLGPLGATESATTPAAAPTEQAPTPPRKEQGARQVSGGAPAKPVSQGENDDALSIRSRGPPPVQAPGPGGARQTQPSVSVEQAAKPTFDILVGDPHKVGDLTSSHIVYQVRTKTTSKAYKQPEFAVSRRYRDFLWLYNSMHSNNPGVVIPPPPEKQAVGRFDTEFVESRRQALERMLNKIAAHPILHHDADLKIFLESEAFNVDVKNKENRDPLLDQTNKGMLSAIGINVGSSSGKFVEHDDWFHDRKIYLDALENQLKALMKALDTVIVQRKGLAEAAGDFATSLGQLAQVELSPTFSGPLQGLSDVQVRIKELYQRQAQQDVLTLGITIDEYVRLIGSVKTAFGQRQKAYHSWHAAESELQKRRNAHDRLLRQGRSQQDKLNEVSASVSDAEKRAHQARLLFEDMGRLMRNELERFEREKVEDFKSGIETFLEGAVEAQKELIELWETFLLQMDADEDEPLNRATMPVASGQTEPGATAAGEGQATSQTADHDHQGHQAPDGPVATATDVALEQDS